MQAVALVIAGMSTTTGLVIGWLLDSDPHTRVLWVFTCCVLLAALAMVLGVEFPQRRFSPVLRRAVEVFEAVLIAAVLPLALAVMDLYAAMRHL